MPRTGGHERREDIVRQAAELFREKGYGGVGVKEILKAAGVSRGSFYFHFKSKRDLCAAVVRYYYDLVPTVFEQLFGEDDWAKWITRLVMRWTGTREESRMMAAPFACLALAFAHSEPHLLKDIAVVMGEVEGRFAKALERYGYPAALSRRRAATVMACMQGHLLRLAMHKDPLCIEQCLRDVVRLGELPSRRRAPRASAGAEVAGDPPGELDPELGAEIDKYLKNRIDIIDNRSIMQDRGRGASRAAAKRSRILTTAAVRFWGRGYHATRVEDILAECDIPKGSFHYYFKSKRELAAEVIDGYGRQCRAAFGAVFSARTWAEAVGSFHYLLDSLDIETKTVACPLSSMGLEVANSDEMLARRVSVVLKIAEGLFEKALRKYYPGISRLADRAALVTALWKGHLVRVVVFKDKSILGELREDLLEVVA